MKQKPSMKLAGIQKLTLLDFPGHTAATVFTPGCNLRCPFCQNVDLVLSAHGSLADAGCASAGVAGLGKREAYDEIDGAGYAGAGVAGGGANGAGAGAANAASAGAGAGVAGTASAGAGGDGGTRSGADTSPGAALPADKGAANAPAKGNAFPVYPIEEFFALLDRRRGLLDGVCVSGGEPLLQPGLADFCAHIHEAGFAVKLDTNGCFPDKLHELVSAGLVDYVAMDVKNAPARYAETVGVPGFDVTPVRASIDYLLDGAVPFEFRTTVMRELHTVDDLRTLARWIESAPAWFIQSFIDSDTVLAGCGRFHPWAAEDLRALLPDLQAIAPTARLRGID